MKRNAGEWLRRWIRDRIREQLLDRVNIGLLAMSGIGWLCGGVAAFLAMLVGVKPGWTIGFVLLLPGVAFVGAAIYKAWIRRSKDMKLEPMKKGAEAEETVGQAIEYALTRESCAVAHNVKEIAKVGDIDHLVATPGGLWVIETKDGFVPKSKFPETLKRIARNVDNVRKWAPPGTPVTGCLVFAHDPGASPKPFFEAGAERIRCFADAERLKHELLAESRKRKEGGYSALARRVWRLGGLEAPA